MLVRVAKGSIVSLLVCIQISLCITNARGMQDVTPDSNQAFSWRPHAILAETYLRQGSAESAIKEAELALELGQGQATAVRPILARALADYGDKDRAISILQEHVKEYPSDVAANILLESLQSYPLLNKLGSGPAAANRKIDPTLAAGVTSLPLNSGWLPPDVDEWVPPLVSRASCDLEDILQKAGNRIREFVSNVDRFTATETLEYEKINKSGIASRPETRKFDYVVSVGEVRPGMLSVDEYRHNRGFEDDFLNAVTARGLPAIVLIFHPYEAVNFEMTCEGLAQLKGTRVWQLHFRQRSDKPNRIRAYRVNGTPYLVSLKGRAWIAEDSYQVLKIETSLVEPVPQIGLAADHTIIEYGPVHFKKDGTDMWLPQSADVYSDLKARRRHEHHSFTNYLLFSVGDLQRISAPKAGDNSSSNPSDDQPDLIRPKDS